MDWDTLIKDVIAVIGILLGLVVTLILLNIAIGG